MNFPNVKNIVFTTDLLKVDDRLSSRAPNPQSINVDWLFELFSGPMGRSMSVATSKYIADEATRIRWYSLLDAPFSSAGWAKHYEHIDHVQIKEEILNQLRESLIVGFELPPALITMLNDAGLGYIDLSIHPYRFGKDYYFGLRSNIQEVVERLNAVTLTTLELEGYVRVSRARSARIYRNRKIEPGSAMFLGQIEIDASLINDNKLASIEDIEYALITLSTNYPKIYYKFHPHLKEKDQITKLLNKFPNCEIIDVNVYDALYAPEFFCYASMSSGSLHEARLFGRKTTRFINSKSDPYSLEEYAFGPVYRPMNQSIFEENFWEYLLRGEELNTIKSDFATDAFKFSLNQKWGR